MPRSDARDCIAWHPEKNGIFTVRSAYNLAMAIKNSALEPSSSTNNPDNRTIWDLIWKADVPPKVRIFGWRVATNTLAMSKKNKCRHTITLDATCDICGCGDEDECHAVVSCTKSRALRYKMREEWVLPAEKHFWNTGEDWL
uniref:Reverse transcriptase zinc-binding domain-containing protein n=1 Tax=Triticum urartu TaxID=4572 RepID=A0A8R7Q696_TRIUA